MILDKLLNLSFSFIESISPSELQQGSIKIMCNTEECFPKAGKYSMDVSPPLSLIHSTFIEAFLYKDLLRETKMSKTGFTVNSFLRCFLFLTFYDLMKMEVRTKRSWWPQSHYRFTFSSLFFLAVFLNQFDSTFFLLIFFFTFFFSSSWDINHLI